MLVVGQDPVYLSHLPMFMSPHDFQVVLEVSFDEAAAKAYRDSGPQAGSEIYTFLPERFALEDLDPAGAHPKTSFTGVLFLGHFERGGTVLREGVTATVTGVPYFHRFDPRPPELPELAYVTFGTGGQRYLAHLVTRAPDFDQILAVEISGGDCGEGGDMPVGESLTVPGRRNTVGQRLQAGPTEPVPAVLGAAQGGTKVSVVARAEIYLETGDLSLRLRFSPPEPEQPTS